MLTYILIHLLSPQPLTIILSATALDIYGFIRYLKYPPEGDEGWTKTSGTDAWELPREDIYTQLIRPSQTVPHELQVQPRPTGRHGLRFEGRVAGLLQPLQDEARHRRG